MAEPLKNYFDAPRVRAIGAMFHAVWAGFPLERFAEEAARGLETLELLDRGRHIGAALARALPADRVEALAILVASLGPPLSRGGTWGMSPFTYLPHSSFVAEACLEVPDAALDAQHALTQRFTAEFCIRPFLHRHPARTFARLALWADDPEDHVRRLVSEGTRSRLPWATRVPGLRDEVDRVLALLVRLRDDPSEYVRRSVANNLNDIGKDDPARLLRVATEWMEEAPAPRRALLAHALRDRVKKGDRDVIALLGHGGGEFRVEATLPAEAALGGTFTVSLHVTNIGAGPTRGVVDLVVTFPGPRRKVFKVRNVSLDAGASVTLKKSISLRDHTTRAARPGPHHLAVQVDGVVSDIGSIAVG
jgi:3-methyladenine DNA glycosylase AlkC